jgi:serine/threonine protein phosphatase PrpC
MNAFRALIQRLGDLLHDTPLSWRSAASQTARGSLTNPIESFCRFEQSYGIFVLLHTIGLLVDSGEFRMNKFDIGYGTHPGLSRKRNEDSYLVAPELGLWIVADGMGGHQAGEVASSIVVRELFSSIKQGKALSIAIESVHREIQAAAAHGRGKQGMGSTVVALKLVGLRYEIGWVGDSRAYLWNGRLQQLTKDHSYVQLMLDNGLINETEALTHPYRNVISRGLGVGGAEKNHVEVDTLSGTLNEGDSLLLCSDGLTKEISDQEIAKILLETGDNQSKVDHLIVAALAAGGRDNITVVLVSPKCYS